MPELSDALLFLKQEATREDIQVCFLPKPRYGLCIPSIAFPILVRVLAARFSLANAARGTRQDYS